MVLNKRLEEFNKIRGDLIDRIAHTLDKLAEFEGIEDVIVEGQIHHSKQKPHIRVLKMGSLKGGFVRLYTYARNGLGYRARVILKRGCNTWEKLQEYVRALNEKRKDEEFYGSFA
jgi:hypothetical protein